RAPSSLQRISRTTIGRGAGTDRVAGALAVADDGADADAGRLATADDGADAGADAGWLAARRFAASRSSRGGSSHIPGRTDQSRSCRSCLRRSNRISRVETGSAAATLPCTDRVVTYPLAVTYSGMVSDLGGACLRSATHRTIHSPPGDSTLCLIS